MILKSGRRQPALRVGSRGRARPAEGEELVAVAANLGFPRIGARRELKKATEAYWKGTLTEEQLLATGRDLRLRHWAMQRAAGLDVIPSNDFSFYDQVLDMACVLGAVPDRFGWAGGPVPLEISFSMARGVADGAGGVPAMEMTKWFDTNYHYIVPEVYRGQRFQLASHKPVEEYREALQAGFKTRPVLIGPVSFLLLSKSRGEAFDRLSLLDGLLPVYQQLLTELRAAGAEWVQLDEPFLVMDPPAGGPTGAAYRRAYSALAEAAGGMRLLVATYFEGLGENLETALALPVDGLHLDLVRAPGQLDAVLERDIPERLTLSLGVVDGRNVWKTDLAAALEPLTRAAGRLGADRI